MVIRPWVMPHATVYGLVGITSSFGTKLPYRPFFVMFGIEELDKLIERITICQLGICL